jgi:hypothetical protein
MSRCNPFAEHRGRHRIPLPPERRAEQPFVFDPRDGHVIAPWPKGKLSAEDEQRLGAVIERIARIEATVVVWLWPDEREPVPVATEAPLHWLMHWARDRAIYALR